MNPLIDYSDLKQQFDQIPIRIQSRNEVFKLNSAYQTILSQMIQVMCSKQSQSLLLWPRAPKGLASVHALLQLAMMAETKIEVVDSAFHTAFFPSSKIMNSNREVHIDREWLLRYVRHRFPTISQQSSEDALFNTLLTLTRLVDLEDLDQTVANPVFPHPVIDELTLFHHLTTGARNPLLYRSSKYTDLPKLNRGLLADAPDTAVWCMSGIDKEARFINKLNRKPDILIMDLTRRSVPWKNFNDFVEKPLKALYDRFHEEIPVLTVTDTPWMHERLHSYILPKYTKIIKTVGQAVSLNKLESLADTEVSYSFSGFDTTRVVSADAGLGALLAKVKKFADESESSDIELSQQVKECHTRITNRISFPVSFSLLRDFIDENPADTDLANGILESCIPRFHKDDYISLIAQKNLSLLSDLEDCINLLNSKLEASPVFGLLRPAISQMTKDSKTTWIVVEDDFFVDLLVFAIKKDPDFGHRLEEILNSGKLRIIDEAEFRTAIKDSSTELLRVIFVQLKRDSIIDLLTLEKLPADNIFLGNSEIFKSLQIDLRFLLKYSELDKINSRFKSLFNAISTSVQGLSVANRLNDDGPSDFSFNFDSKVIDMRPKNSTGSYIQIISTDGKKVLAPRGAKVITYDRGNPLNPFGYLIADEIEPEMDICPISELFIQVARQSVYSKVSATEEVREYHKTIQRLLPTIAGSNLKEKALVLQNLMAKELGDKAPGLYSVKSWLNVDSRIADDITVVRPNAPKTWESFSSFMKALGVNREIIELFWSEGVVATRSLRLSKGHDFHDTYLSILLNPERVELKNPSYVSVIGPLRQLAERNVKTVKFCSVEVT